MSAWIPVPINQTPENNAGAKQKTVVFESPQNGSSFTVENPGRKDYPNQNVLNPYPD
jgi:hypothetical protein